MGLVIDRAGRRRGLVRTHCLAGVEGSRIGRGRSDSRFHRISLVAGVGWRRRRRR